MPPPQQPADPNHGQPLRLEVTALSGRGHGLTHRPVGDRRLLLTVAGHDTLTDLLRATLAGFGLDDADHLAQFRLRPDRARAAADEPRPPMRPDDIVYALGEPAGTGPEPPGWDVPVSAILGAGQAGYLRFDLGAEWWWRVRAMATGAQAAGPPVTQYEDPTAPRAATPRRDT